MSHPVLILILVLALPTLEIYLLIQLGSAIGFFGTLLLVLGGAVLGGWLLRHQGLGSLARIRAALRHRVQEEGAEPVFRSGDLAVDLVRRLVTVSGEEVKLSPKEYDILRLLVIHAGKVLTHRMIMQDIWGAAGDVQYLRIYIRQLRQKLERNPERPGHIVTETGIGYRLRLPD